ncbi:unnamed protein product [Prorocentrum cordatum]|uniref:Uncharacterized protein n=1 Tax=Prorocentrum cordatum TaxID=2364126 RepID=A0ABN9YKB7_9DINO|nr:unnamed protein product [Polarella glacialis]
MSGELVSSRKEIRSTSGSAAKELRKGRRHRHQGAERLEWLVNRACGPSQACDACVRQRGADEAPGRLWCKCLGALEQSRQRLRVPLVLAVAAVAHAAVALTATAEHAAAAAAGGAERGGEARLLSEPLVREIELGGGSPVRSAGASEASYSEMPPAPGRA